MVASAITTALDKVIVDYPKLDLTKRYGYNAEAVKLADKDLMRVVYGAAIF